MYVKSLKGEFYATARRWNGMRAGSEQRSGARSRCCRKGMLASAAACGSFPRASPATTLPLLWNVLSQLNFTYYRAVILVDEYLSFFGLKAEQHLRTGPAPLSAE